MREPGDGEEAVAAVGVDPRAYAGTSIADLARDFSSAGTFWEYANFMAGWDPHFGLKDWARVFRTVPSLRKYLLPALAWNALLWLGGRRGYPGFSERYQEGRTYNFRYRSFCTDFLVWESVGRACRHFALELPAGVPAAVEAHAALAFRNCYEVPWEAGKLPLFSYFPRFDHLVSKDTAAYKLFFSRDDNVPDLDTSCIILGSLIALRPLLGLSPSAYAHGSAESLALLGLLEAHVAGKGRYGQASFSYDNGILPGDDGILTWVFDDHNELDPTSNINILNWLALSPLGREGVPADRIAALARGIFRFLLNHVRDGSFTDARFQSYYPLGPVYFFWLRFIRNFRSLPETVQAALDPEGAAALIDDHLVRRGIDIFIEGRAETNPFDRLAAAPFLYERGFNRKEAARWLEPDPGKIRHFRNNHYEIFHLRYPSKIFCAPLRFPDACALELAILVDKFPPE